MANSKSIFNLSYSQDNPNINKLIEGTFNAITKDDIRVGYIDPDQGYVVNVTICQANDYAKKNPGTRFIFKDGNGNLRYININEVNKLTPNDIISKDKCSGIQTAYNCNQPPAIQILGGGGVGAVANAVIGADGSLIAIDVVEGGYGYQYPPQIKIVDECNIGAGAVGFASIGDIADTVEIYEGEFEDYEICEPNDVGYGKVYGPNGEDLGDWDPTLYTNRDSNSIALEIKKYQEAVNNPFWTTKKYKPSSIVSADKKNYNQSYSVTFPDWNEFMNKYAISPVSPSNVPGSDNAGRLFIMQWDVDFPYDGEYIFRGLCDNVAKFYIDNVAVGDLKSFKDAVKPLTQTIKQGIHNVRIDLLNNPITETKTTQQTSSNTNLTIAYDGLNASNNPINVQGNKILLKDGSGNDTNATFSIVSSDPGVNARFSPDGKKIDYDKAGNVNIKLEWKDDPNTAGVAVKTISVGGVTLIQKDRTGSDSKSFSISTPIKASTSVPSTTTQSIQTKKVFNTIDYINKANRQLWRIDPNASSGSGFINQYGILPFDPKSKEAQTESFVGTHTIIWDNINFPVDGNYTVHVAVDDNVTLYIGDTVIKKQGFYPRTSTGTPDLDQQYVFKKGTYTIRAELEQISGNPLGKGNPMSLAVDINVDYAIQEFVSAKSWNENPMGVALTIDAPEPPIPQEKLPVQEGRCPPNPIWSTRFPNSKQKWIPVTYKTWAKFFNQYAISPIPPLNTPGSDGTGVIYRNSWSIDIPYDGIYKFQVQRDDTARIYIDGKIAFDVKTSGDEIWKDFRNKVKSQKVFISKGKHEIEIELENKPAESFSLIDQKIFSTKDWLVPPPVTTSTSTTNPIITYVGLNESNNPINVQGNKILLKDGSGNDTNATFSIVSSDPGVNARFSADGKKIEYDGDGNITINLTWKDDPNTAGVAVQNISVGGVTLVQKDRTGSDTKTFKVSKTSTTQSTPVTKNGVTYDGPTSIANYKADFISPLIQDINAKPNEEIQGKTWIFRWSNVDFPEDGEYTLTAEADDLLNVRVDGVGIGSAKTFAGRKTTSFNTTKGKRTVELELSNISIPNTGFQENPTVAFAEIYKKIQVKDNKSKKSWLDNPVGIGAILIPPPCPKKVSGKGVIKNIDIIEPGNGYSPSQPNNNDGYPATLQLTDVIVTNPGLNYNCGVDKLKIVPDLGCKLNYTCDSFGRINKVTVDAGCYGFTEYPTIYMDTETGVNFSAVPVFSVVRDPIGVTTERLIQVTDLVGLKQTGYVNGKPYYGAVYYDNSLRYAGYYQSVGTPVRVYDTLQESITGEVTTPPSAIERFGTDVNSNNPRLNIPGTPENTTGP